MQIRNKLFTSMRTVPIPFRIQGVKPIRIHAYPDRCQTLPSQKVEFLHENYTLWLCSVAVLGTGWVKNPDPGSAVEKNRIRDKIPGSAPLVM
jgi:hypothetical protein